MRIARTFMLMAALALLLLGFRSAAWAAAYTASQTGFWRLSSTWGGAGVPGAGDTVTIPGFTVTVDDTRIIGTSPGAGAATAAILVNGTNGSLVIDTAGNLTVRGDININSSTSTFSMNAGATLQFDAANVGTNKYVLSFNTGNAGGFVNVGATGSSARCTIKTINLNMGAGQAYITRSATGFQGLKTVLYTDFTDMGDATNNASQTYAGAAGNNVTFDHDTFTGCGAVQVNANSNATGAIAVTSNTFTGSTGTYCFDLRFNGAKTTGTRTFTGNICDIAPQWSTAYDMTISDNVFLATPGNLSQSATAAWASFSNNLLYFATSGTMINPNGDMVNNYLAGLLVSNPHWINMPTALNFNGTGNIFEDVSQSNGGDGDVYILGTAPLALHTYTLKYNLCLLTDGTGLHPGTFITLGGSGNSANTALTMEHNTFPASSGQPAAAVEETSNGVAGSLVSFKSNLIWAAAVVDRFSYKLYSVLHPVSGGIQDIASPTSLDYNGSWNLHTETPSVYPGNSIGTSTNTYTFAGKGYQLNLSAAPGAHDVDGVNPNFVDGTRNLGKWWTNSLGNTTTGTNAGDAAAAVTYIKGAPGARISALITWVKAGFVPRASAFHAAHDNVAPTNGWIGAFEGLASTVQRRRPGSGRTGTRTIGVNINLGRAALQEVTQCVH